MQKLMSTVRYWIVLGVIITALCGLVYGTVQQNFRQTANDPQIQMSEDLAIKLQQGQGVSSLVSREPVDIGASLAPFIIVYSDDGTVIASTAKLDGQVPVLPSGVLDYTREHRQDRITWQPKPEARSATVITRFANDRTSGFVLVGRSLREVEKREDRLFLQVGIAWVVTMIASLLATFLFPYRRA